MEKYGELVTPTTLRFERMLPGPIERVWEYITDAEKRAKWFCGGSSEQSKGDTIKFVFNNSKLGSPPDPTPDKYKEFGDGFESQAVVLTAQKPTLFSIEWDGVVTFELSEQGEQVKLVLTHDKIKDDPETRTGAMAGWHTHLGILIDLLNDRDPKGFWSVHMGFEDEYAQRINN